MTRPRIVSIVAAPASWAVHFFGSKSRGLCSVGAFAIIVDDDGQRVVPMIADGSDLLTIDELRELDAADGVAVEYVVVGADDEISSTARPPHASPAPRPPPQEPPTRERTARALEAFKERPRF